MAERALFTTMPGETVTAFALSAMQETPFNGAVTRGVENVDYKFINGFVDVGDLPCRVALWDDVANRPTPALEEFATSATNLPGFNRRLDFSGFWHLPTRLARWAKCTLIPPAGGDHPFRIATCGGVHIWVDGEHVTGFEPYSRNHTQETEITLPLRQGGSELVLLIEDLAERDINFFVELTWLGEGALQSAIPGNADPAALTALMDLARSVHPDKVAFAVGDALELSFASPAPQDVQISGEVHPSVHLSHMPPLFSATTTLVKGATTASLGDLAGLDDGYHPLSLTFSIGDTRVERGIGFAYLRDQQPLHLPGTLAARKKLALDHAARHGEMRVGRLLAQLATGLPFDASSQAILDDTLAGINDRRDCSDFVMVPLLWIYGAYRDALPDEAATAIRAAILNYRYWMDEPGNDAMWFWSENHVLCFHVSEYIAGRLLTGEIFPNAGLTGAEHLALAETRLDRWLSSVEAHGLAEWNSAAYYPIDFIGLLALEYWGEGALKTRAAALLDQLFTMIALHTIGGVSAGTMGRADDKELRAGPLTELAPFATVAFGTGWLNNGVAALPMFCASDYAPPAELTAYAAPQAPISAHYVQGYGTAARLALYKTPTMQLSASIDGAPGAGGHQQHLVDIQSAAHPFARAWVNHPGEDDPWGSNRPSYWAGNGIMPRVGMDGDCCLVLSDLGDSPRLPFTHAYAPLSEFDAHLSGEDWLALQSGAGFVLLKATGPITPVTTGPGAGLEHRANGTRTGWAIIAGDLPAGGLDAVADMARAMSLTLQPDPLRLMLRRPGQPNLTLDYATGLARDGVALPFPTNAQIPQVTVGVGAAVQ
ncbi:MAG: hypothetical protein P8X66_01500 [Maritimibacter sp.]